MRRTSGDVRFSAAFPNMRQVKDLERVPVAQQML
jgi:hypothetical protein